MNRIILSGFVATEPITRYTNNGNIVTHISLSVRKGKKNSDGTGYLANFFDVDAWGKTAEIAKERMEKGDFVTIEGRLDNDMYEKEGKKQTRTKVIAEYIEYAAARSEQEEVPQEEGRRETASSEGTPPPPAPGPVPEPQRATMIGDVAEEEIPF